MIGWITCLWNDKAHLVTLGKQRLIRLLLRAELHNIRIAFTVRGVIGEYPFT